MSELARAAVAEESDVFAIRQRGREIAAAVGFDEQDQVRIGTALSEVSREVLDPGGGGEVVFAVDPLGATLAVSVTCRCPLAAPSQASGATGLAGAARLLDVLELDETGMAVRLAKALPAHARLTAHHLDALRARLASSARTSPLDELRTQNQQLLDALDQLSAKQADLLRLNEELEETNRGVMAMYSQLSEELEETNRGVVALYADLDDRTLQLQHANESKSRFLSNVSHELRTPINSVVAMAKLLLEADSAPLTADQRHQVGLILSSASELLGLVNTLLDLAKAESGRLQPHIGDCNLRDLFADLRGTFRPLVGAGTSLDVPDPDVSMLATDKTLLTHALRNLLSNAVKFTERGVISLRAHLAGSGSEQSVVIAVEDTGIGIDPADQQRVFDEFFQVLGPLQTRQRGTGLGLPYVRQVVTVLGGRVELASEPGAGTTVTIRLPTRPSTSPTAPPVPSPQPASPPPATVGTALIVDDDPAFRRLIRTMLEGRARRVLEAESGAAALAAIAANTVDVMFLDLRMPDGDGTDVLARMGEDPALRAIPVVIVTSTDIDVTQSALLRRRATIAKSDLDRGRIDAALRQLDQSDPHE